MPVRIPVEAIQRLCDPFHSCVWGDFVVTREMVMDALVHNRFCEEPMSAWTKEQHCRAKSHAERIAYLAYNGWDDAIQIDVGVPGLNCYVDWPVQDGNHRLAAAIFRGDYLIKVFVDGDIGYAGQLFGIDVTERDRDYAEASF